MWHQRFAAFLLLLAVWTCDSASGQEEEGERGSRSSAEIIDRLGDNMTAPRGVVRLLEDVENKLTTLGQTHIDLSTQMKKMQRALTDIQNGIALTCKAPELPPLIDKLLRDSEGYYLAFRLTAGIKKSAYAEYTNAGYNDDESDLTHHMVPCGCKSTNGSLYCDRHYRSVLMDLWPHLPVEKVKVSVYKAGVEERRFVFDGRHSDSLSFFEQARLQQDQYNDLSSSEPNNPPRPNYFSISGDANTARRFFINNNYGGCRKDTGWLVVADSNRNFPCTKIHRYLGNYPFILYTANGVSRVPGYLKTKWLSGTVRMADVLTVSIKLRDLKECPAGSH